MSGRRTGTGWWRSRRARRVDAPPKDHVYAAVDDEIVQRLSQMRLPEPPATLRERDRRSYDAWLKSQAGRHRWRDY